MLIVSPIKSEGIYNFESMFHIFPVRIEDTYSLQFTSSFGKGYIGDWSTQEEVEKAMEEIVKAHHLGYKEVYL